MTFHPLTNDTAQSPERRREWAEGERAIFEQACKICRDYGDTAIATLAEYDIAYNIWQALHAAFPHLAQPPQEEK